jgi:GntR family transcriptional regulator / MocR family aminotransferase
MRNELTSSDRELLLRLERDGPEGLTSQLCRQLRQAIRKGSLREGVQLPSTRALARELRVSRPVIVDAYAQLAAEGYLRLRQGARPTVAAIAMVRPAAPERRTAAAPIRFDLRPNLPDLAAFPRRVWLAALRGALGAMTHDELGYDEPHGTLRLRGALADYLGRVRGVVAEPDRILVTSGFAERRALFCEVLRTLGIGRLAIEDPSFAGWHAIDEADLMRVPIQAGEQGIDLDALAASRAHAVLLTPAHQFPGGGILSAARRQGLIAWLEQRDALAIEDDYDADFRYGQAPIGALQGLSPDRVVYAGTASKTLAPALRLGWLVVPAGLLGVFKRAQRRWSEGGPRIDQNALALLIESGAYDRHLRRMRRIYGARRDLVLRLVGELIPEARVEGVAAGLHATIGLPRRADAPALKAELRRQGVAIEEMSRYRSTAGPPALLIGYARPSESALRSGLRLLARMMAKRGGAEVPRGEGHVGHRAARSRMAEEPSMADQVTIYGIKNCDTMKKARAWLDGHGVAYAFHDYKSSGIGRSVLERWARQAGWETLLNRQGTTFRKLPEASKTGIDEGKALALMQAEPSMIKRPVLETGGKLMVGFTPERYAGLFG